MRARPAADIFRFGFAWPFTFAQRALWAAAMRALPAADIFRRGAFAVTFVSCAPPSSIRRTRLNFAISSLIPCVMDSRLILSPHSLDANRKDSTRVSNARASGCSEPNFIIRQIDEQGDKGFPVAQLFTDLR
jgi:hypothetical protein